MTQRELESALARATGESSAEIRRLGFQLEPQLDLDCEPDDRDPLTIDWDRLDQERVAIYP